MTYYQQNNWHKFVHKLHSIYSIKSYRVQNGLLFLFMILSCLNWLIQLKSIKNERADIFSKAKTSPVNYSLEGPRDHSAYQMMCDELITNAADSVILSSSGFSWKSQLHSRSFKTGELFAFYSSYQLNPYNTQHRGWQGATLKVEYLAVFRYFIPNYLFNIIPIIFNW